MLNQMEKKRIFANNVLILLFLVLNIMLGIVLNSCASNSMQPIVIWALLLFSALNGTYFIFCRIRKQKYYGEDDAIVKLGRDDYFASFIPIIATALIMFVSVQYLLINFQ